MLLLRERLYRLARGVLFPLQNRTQMSQIGCFLIGDKDGDLYGIFTLRNFGYCNTQLRRGATESAAQSKTKHSNAL